MREPTTRGQYWRLFVATTAKKTSLRIGRTWAATIYGIAGMAVAVLMYSRDHDYHQISEWWDSCLYFTLAAAVASWCLAFIVSSVLTPYELYTGVESKLIESQKEMEIANSEKASESALQANLKQQQQAIIAKIDEAKRLCESLAQAYKSKTKEGESVNEAEANVQRWMDDTEQFVLDEHGAFYGEVSQARENADASPLKGKGSRSLTVGQVRAITDELSAILSSLR